MDDILYVPRLLIVKLFADTFLSPFFRILTFLLHSTELTGVIKGGEKSYIIQIENRFTHPTARLIH